MYNVNAAAAACWEALFARISERAGVEVTPLDYPPPLPIDALWARDDMGLVLMCGWPFSRAHPQPVPLAAPVLSDPHAKGQPVYWSDMIVRADAPFQTVQDCFGHRLAWTIKSSHSGYNAPRRLFLDYLERGAPLFRETIGDVISPMGAIEAVVTGRADLAPLDGYFHLLVKRFDPDLAAQIRVVARTPSAPVPLLVASVQLTQDKIDALRGALIAAHDCKETAQAMQALAIERFVRVVPEEYALGNQWEAEAIAAGYPDLV